MERPGWHDDAPCRGKIHLFFPAHAEQPGAATVRNRKALAICAACPYVEPCREWADSNSEDRGVWAGEIRKGVERVRDLEPARQNRTVEYRRRSRTVQNPSHGTYRAYTRHIEEGTDPCQACLDAQDARRAFYREQNRRRGPDTRTADYWRDYRKRTKETVEAVRNTQETA
jgi:WhiB family redox-sensing transcriptional regulator